VIASTLDPITRRHVESVRAIRDAVDARVRQLVGELLEP
jgi:hypothetical protein